MHLSFKKESKFNPHLINLIDKDYRTSPLGEPVCIFSESYWIIYLGNALYTRALPQPSPLLVQTENEGLIPCHVITKDQGKRTRLVLTSRDGLLDGVLIQEDGYRPTALRTLYANVASLYSRDSLPILRENLRAAKVPSLGDLDVTKSIMTLLKRAKLPIGPNFKGNIIQYSKQIDKYPRMTYNRHYLD